MLYAASGIFPYKFTLSSVPLLVRCARAGTLFLISICTICKYNKRGSHIYGIDKEME